MADPRVTGQIDSFIRADESPLSNGGMWTQSFTTVDYMDNRANRACRHEPHTYLTAMSHYTFGIFGDDVEVWGKRYEGGLLIGHREILFMFVDSTMGGAFAGNADGYLFYIHTQNDGTYHYLYRVDNGTLTLLQNVEPADHNWVLLRTNGDYVETWNSETGGDDWSLVCQVTDTTYRSNFRIGIGEADNSGATDVQTGWEGFGGGIENTRPTLPLIIRRTPRERRMNYI